MTQVDRASLAASVLAEEERRHAEEAARSLAGVDTSVLDADIAALLPEEPPSSPADLALAAPLAPILALGLVAMGDDAARAALAVLGPDIRDSLGMTDLELSLAVALAGMVGFLAAVPLGALADRRRRPSLAGLAGVFAALGTLFAASASALGALNLGRMATGLGGAARGPVHGAWLADATPPNARHRTFALTGLVAAFGILGAGIAPAVAEVAGGPTGWRWGLAAASVPTLVGAAMALRLTDPDRGAAERSAAGVPQPTTAADRPGVLAELGALRASTGIRALLSASAAVGLLTITVPLMLNIVLADVHDLRTAARGAAFLGTLPGVMLGLAVAGGFGDRRLRTEPESHVRSIAVALVAAAIALVLAGAAPGPFLVTAAGFVVAAAGAYVSVCVTAVLTTITPGSSRGVTLGLAGVYASFGGGVFGALVLGLLANSASPGVALAIGGGGACIVSAALVHRGETTIRADLAGTIRTLRDEAAVSGDDAEVALQVRNVDFSYGHVQVLFDVSLDVKRGEVLALLGTNGAGKSTILRAISGLSPVDRGTIRHGGRNITFDDARLRVTGGIVQVPGGKAVFPSLTVAENLLAGAYTYIWDRARLQDRVEDVVGLFPVLRDRLDQPAGTLSGGEQQMLALAKALLLDPDILCIDELSLGLAPVIVQDLIEVVEGLKAKGMTMVIVEQSLNVALAIADRAVFMEKGRVRFEGAAQELAERDDLARAVFLGGEGG